MMADHSKTPKTGLPADCGPIPGVLNGLRVIEIGHYIAAPFCTRILADLGAEVIKVEPPEGDPVRVWGDIDGKGSPWWSVHGRNKKCITLDLKREEGRDILLKLVESADAVVENFRPGQLERWKIGFTELCAHKPDLILVRISGYGQNGPYRDKVSFGVIGEAMGGIRHLTGYPKDISDLPPVRVGISIGDSLAGLYGIIGLLGSLFEQSRAGAERKARCIDVALYEAVFSMLEGILPEYGHYGVIRQPTGSEVAMAAPSNAYLCADGVWMCIAANSDRIFGRLAALMGKAELAADSRFRSNPGRIEHRRVLDRIIGDWAKTLTADEAQQKLDAADIPAGRIYTVADCAKDPHFRARGMIEEIPDPRFGSLLHPGVVPKFADGRQGGGIGWPGPEIGAHNEAVLCGLAGIAPSRLDELRRAGVI